MKDCLVFVMICAVWMLSGPVAARADNATNGLMRVRAAILKHREYFEKNMQSQDNVYVKRMAAFLEQLETKLPGELDFRIFLRRVGALSKSGRHSAEQEATGLIKDDQVVDVYVSALESGVAGLEEASVKWLLWDVGRLARSRQEQRIREALGPRPKCFERIKLYALLDLSPEEKEQVLSWKNAPLTARARCGDREAEAKLIEQFEGTKVFPEKVSLARQLAYAATPACRAALVRGLNSPLSFKSELAEDSVRSYILMAMGLIYQEEPLFTSDAYMLHWRQPSHFNEERGLNAYIHDVDRWVREHYEHSAWDTESVWFRRGVTAVPRHLWKPIRKDETEQP